MGEEEQKGDLESKKNKKSVINSDVKETMNTAIDHIEIRWHE